MGGFLLYESSFSPINLSGLRYSLLLKVCLEDILRESTAEKKNTTHLQKHVWMIVDSEEAVELGKSPQVVTLLVCQIMSKLIE